MLSSLNPREITNATDSLTALSLQSRVNYPSRQDINLRSDLLFPDFSSQVFWGSEPISQILVTNPGDLASNHFGVPTIMDSASCLPPDSISDPQRERP